MKRAVVTGARGGIGSAAAAALERRGFEVVGLDAGDDWEAAFDALDRLDVLACAHGGSGRSHGDGPVDACTDEGWDWTLELNLTTVFRYCRRAIPLLRANGGGAVVTVSSALALGADPDFATHAYTAAKGALVSLTRAMAVTYAGDGIRCNVVCPGLIATPMSARAQSDERILGRLPELQPLTGGFGDAADVGEAIAYLAEARFTTGAVLTVDGGWSAR
ncbi:MAG TPA: SDR family oxidoreductase [Gaiellaceae bacterium]|nr:SDR family oxidoreductase [Gaiellaceae bacterium]